MASRINIYSLFSDIRNNCSRYLKKTILDIQKYVSISDIQNSVDIKNNNFRYQKIGNPKLLFWISEIIISDIRNYSEQTFYLRYLQ